jgi:RNA binding exosome subunit
MPKSEVDSVEVSFFLHATEDRQRVVETVKGRLGMGVEPTYQEMEGHFGNRITRVSFEVKKEDAQRVFEAVSRLLLKAGGSELKANLGEFLDERGSLYLRLDKQEFMRGSYAFGSGDPVRIKVRPRAFAARGDPVGFYRRLMGLGE